MKYENTIESKFNGAYSRNHLHEIMDGAYVINLITHWIASYVNGDNAIYFDSFGVECIPKEIKKKSKAIEIL